MIKVKGIESKALITGTGNKKGLKGTKFQKDERLSKILEL